MYFDHAWWTQRRLNEEIRSLETIGSIYSDLYFPRRYPQTEEAIPEMVEHHGYKRVARRLLDLLTKEEYTRGELHSHHFRLAMRYADLPEVKKGFGEYKGHATLAKKTWALLRDSAADSSTEEPGFGPGACADLLNK